MFDHQYRLKELQKQRANEIKKMMVETNHSKKKPLKCYLPIFKTNGQCVYE
ncbi:hypothetical protein [Pseudoneobacillus sp. C159]